MSPAANESGARARGDLRYLDQLLARARSRVDPHAFHYVHWGAIVLVWYPLANVFELAGHPWWQLPLGLAATVLGITLSIARETRLACRPRLEGEDPSLGRQVALTTFGAIAAGMILSGVAPATRFVEGEDVPILWGLVYSAIAFQTGVVYRREFLWASAFIFAGTILAMFFPSHDGLILGPVMGLGAIVPGVRAERHVRRMREASAAEDAEGEVEPA